MNSQKDAERIRAEMSIAQAIYDAICEMNGSSYRQDKVPLRWDTSSGTPLSLMSIDGFFEGTGPADSVEDRHACAHQSQKPHRAAVEKD
ncbi:hypothetical protein NKJ84_31005 [Mesorhizobium sp. M0048]|uniref:hypothetical protein n=1 Tax=Mesorhizobium sp. M0048 TaxID=2956860 RepID=UPI00333BC64B